MIRMEFVQRTLKVEAAGARTDAFSTVSTDSRSAPERSLFFALTGPNFNGHDFVVTAAERGATGAVVERSQLERLVKALGKRISRFVLFPVPDVLQSLGDLAAAWRKQSSAKVAALTGSNGKTTTKEMISSILSRLGQVHRTEGNLNNLIGLPLTIFGIGPQHDFAVLEMGMNRPGEIARLSAIASPEVAVVTNVHAAHLEGLGSISGVADEKWSIFTGLPPSGTAVWNADDPELSSRSGSLKGRSVSFGASAGSGVRLVSAEPLGAQGQRIALEIEGSRIEARIRHLGRHNAINAAAAAAAAHALGADAEDIAAGLSAAPVVGRRLQHETAGGVHLLNDVYNANPASMETAIKTLNSVKGGGRAFAVLGDMLELGGESGAFHEKLGRHAGVSGLDGLIVLGPLAARIAEGAAAAGMDAKAVLKAVDAQDAAWLLNRRVKAGDWVLVKGSRGMRMERVLEEFRLLRTGGEG